MGVEHFYLFNHFSEDHYYPVLEPYIEEGLVELIDWPYKAHDHKSWVNIQCGAYNRLIENRGRESFWMAIIDTDEFIFPLEKKTIPSFLKDYEEFGGVCINWQHYGTSNIYRIPYGETLIGSMTYKAREDHPRNYFVKTIFQPKKISKVKKPHHCKYLKGYFHVTENKERFADNKSLTETVSVNKIRINHYIYRDKEFFYTEKRRRVQEWFPGDPPIDMIPDYNRVEDLILLPIAEKVKDRINSSGPFHNAFR